MPPTIKRILSIDAGGIRGIIPARVLVDIEAMLQDRDGPDVRISDYFDLVAGTSTGGLLCCMLLCPEDPEPRTGEPCRPRYTAREALDIYVDNGALLFARGFTQKVRRVAGLFDERYPSTGFRQVLDSHIPARADPDEHLMLSELLRPCVIPTYNTALPGPDFFKQHQAHLPGRNFTVRDVALATSAAPSYFEPMAATSEIGASWPFVDGGVFASNPAMCAYAEARKLFGVGVADMAMLSLGTGAKERSYLHDEIKDWGLPQWARGVLDMMMSGSECVVDHQLATMFGTGGGNGSERYLRLQADLTEAPDSVAKMDNISSDNLAQLVDIGAALARDNRRRIERFIDTHLTAEA